MPSAGFGFQRLSSHSQLGEEIKFAISARKAAKNSSLKAQYEYNTAAKALQQVRDVYSEVFVLIG